MDQGGLALYKLEMDMDKPVRVVCPKCYSTILPKPLGCMCKPSDNSETTIKTMECTAPREESGVVYQRCGGGRRVLRKRIGGE